MKASILFCAILLAGVNIASAQQRPYNTKEYLDINNIKAAHLVHGDMWYDPAAGTSQCEYPQGSGKHVGYLGSLWMAGYDDQGNLKVSAQTYRQSNQNDYWPGPADDASFPTDSLRAKAWNKIWKIDRTAIDLFKAISTHTMANTPAMILTWPAKGNPYAAGSLPLTISREMAPFVDVNGDGTYNPLTGDYPDIKGDQMLWWIINDLGPTHNESQSPPLGVEVHHMAYAYKRGGPVDNILFYEFTVVNRSTYVYSNYRLGFNSDLDIGNPTDDYLVFDSARRVGLQHNAISPDGNGQANSYGTNIPAAGITMLELPGDRLGIYVPVASFVPYDNDYTATGNPQNAVEFHNLLSDQSRTGVFMHYSQHYYSVDTTMCMYSATPKDRRFVIAGPDDTLMPRRPLKYAIALVISPGAGACPNPDFTGILATTDTAWKVYHNPPAPPTGIPYLMAATKALRIYPNPATNLVNIEVPDAAKGTVKVYDAAGKIIVLPVTLQTNKIIIATNALAPGIYLIEYRSSETVANNIFVKQ